jgi:hypothetical protein
MPRDGAITFRDIAGKLILIDAYPVPNGQSTKPLKLIEGLSDVRPNSVFGKCIV